MNQTQYVKTQATVAKQRQRVHSACCNCWILQRQRSVTAMTKVCKYEKKHAAQESFLQSSHAFILAAALTVAGVLAACRDPGDTTRMLELAPPTEKHKRTHTQAGSPVFVKTLVDWIHCADRTHREAMTFKHRWIKEEWTDSSTVRTGWSLWPEAWHWP